MSKQNKKKCAGADGRRKIMMRDNAHAAVESMLGPPRLVDVRIYINFQKKACYMYARSFELAVLVSLPVL